MGEIFGGRVEVDIETRTLVVTQMSDETAAKGGLEGSVSDDGFDVWTDLSSSSRAHHQTAIFTHVECSVGLLAVLSMIVSALLVVLAAVVALLCTALCLVCSVLSYLLLLLFADHCSLLAALALTLFSFCRSAFVKVIGLCNSALCGSVVPVHGQGSDKARPVAFHLPKVRNCTTASPNFSRW
jgi:hypothetical protein